MAQIFPALFRRSFSSFSSSLLQSKGRILTSRLGAVVDVPNLKDYTNTEDGVAEIKEALNEAKGLLVFSPQEGMTPYDHFEFAKKFGVPEPHPIVQGLPELPEVLQIVREPNTPVNFGETWHSDNSYMFEPTSLSILRATDVIPDQGKNDTIFVSTEAAYQGLSDHFKSFLSSLTCVHSASKAFVVGSNKRFEKSDDEDMKYDSNASFLHNDAVHPVIRTHPETGRKSIFVNSMFTTKINGLTQEESDSVLKFLCDWVGRPEFMARVSWLPNQLVIWDNRCTQHMALSDDVSQKRVMQRVSLKGEVPQ